MVNFFYEIALRCPNPRDVCVLWTYNLLSIGEVVRSCSFVISLYVLTRKSTEYFPFPFSWVFVDLTKFIFEPMCLQIFTKYLDKKEPKSK